MDRNSFLVWWLLGIPVVLAIVDRMMIGKSSTSSTGVADGYVARQDGRSAAGRADQATARPL